MNDREARRRGEFRAHGGSARPLTAGDMADLMAPLGPFEPAPRLAVAVSGGMDSMALAVLLDDWSAGVGGRVVALVVDHGLRRGSAAEARRVGGWLGSHGIERRGLVWRAPRPGGSQQAAARAARYDLLIRWCARHGILHLATAHHQDDQAETLLLRLGRGSGPDGLAAMPAVRELRDLRLLRPLLTVPKARLEATLRSRGLPWVEDPSNQNPAFARTGLRRQRPALDALGLSAPRLAATAEQLGRTRAAVERDVARLLAEAVDVDPAGFAWADAKPLIAAGAETGARALARVLLAISGREYTPRSERLLRLYRKLGNGAFQGATLAGCRILPRSGRLLIAREVAPVQTVTVTPGDRLRWDGRFDAVIARELGGATGRLALGALGRDGLASISGRTDGARIASIPPAARPSLPALSDARGPLAVPHLGFVRGESAAKVPMRCLFAPENPLTEMRFTVA